MGQRSVDWKKKIIRRLDKEQRSLSVDALLGMLKVKRGERPAVLLQLQQMELDGMLVRTKKGKLRLSEEAVGRPAVLLSLSSGFAFVRLEDTAEDCFVPGKALRGALPGDRVLVHVDEGDKRGPSGRILKILEGGDHLFTGKLIQDQDKSFQVMGGSFHPVSSSGKTFVGGERLSRG